MLILEVAAGVVVGGVVLVALTTFVLWLIAVGSVVANYVRESGFTRGLTKLLGGLT